ncbi:rhodanese-like domain-containing protein [Clostridium sp. AWRP]|uniref:rhodanese-like domain-containing protein n=1 Tax=Clostridium sp. AWRP TaxID=2212991 RepID=UPI000FD86101|nr:rhodanese-like domain-containing protein [Clostridium sp. AWRP]AZV57827.1 rhodanese-like domain-containing protein [Clostridium sp. AWRP]
MSFFNLFTQKSSSKISDKKLKEMLESSTPPLLIDVRTPEEYSRGHISKSKNIPVQNFEDSIKKMGLKLDSPIVVYCQSGMRASQASKILNKLGFEEIYNLGGIGNWSYGLKR